METSRTGPTGVSARTLLLLGLLAIIGIYGLQRGNGFIYDDHLLVIDSPPLSSSRQLIEYFSGTHYTGQHYYRPVTKLAYGLEKRFFGTNPAPYHAVNVALVGLVFVLFCAILRRLYPGGNSALPIYFALLCCLHPVTASVVYPVSGMETLLVTVFAMASLLCYLRESRAGYPLALLFLALALLTKEQGVIVPALLALTDLTGLRDARPLNWRGVIARWAGIAVITLAYLLVRLAVFGGSEFSPATSAVAGTPAQSLLYTLQVVFTPFLHLYYEPYYAAWFSPARAVVAVLLALLLACALYLRRESVGRSTLFWSAYFFLALLPTANLVSQETPFAERYVFAALPALCGLLVALFHALGIPQQLRFSATALAVLALLASVLVTLNRGPYYRDDLTFSRQWLQTNPEHPGARTLYGNALLRLNRTEEATRHFEQSLGAATGDAQQFNSLGILYAADGRVEDARAMFEQALQLDPRYAAAEFNLIHLERMYGDARRARVELESALSRHPGYAEEHYRLGVLYENEGELEKSRAQWKIALQIDPSHQGAQQALQRTAG